jgi:hypothetical protein
MGGGKYGEKLENDDNKPAGKFQLYTVTEGLATMVPSIHMCLFSLLIKCTNWPFSQNND